MLQLIWIFNKGVQQKNYKYLESEKKALISKEKRKRDDKSDKLSRMRRG